MSWLVRPVLVSSLLALLGVGLDIRPASAQALLPYTLPLDEERLTATGFRLAQEAAQLAQFQQYDEALARAELAAQLAPGDASVLTLLGSLQLQTGDSAAAIASLETAKAIDNDDAVIWFTLGSAYFREAKYLQASSSLQKGLELEPNNYGAHFDLGNAYYKLSRYQSAIEEYKKAIDIDASFWPAINNIGLVMYEQGKLDAAIEQWQRSLEVATDETEPTLAIAAARYAANIDRTQAIQLATLALERDSRYADLDFLAENLWGARLLGATEQLFKTPALQELLAGL